MANNFLMGGKLGDFLHAMYAVKHLSERNDTAANVYMYDIGWEHGINNTWSELKPILESQSYINELSVLKNYELHPVQTAQQSKPILVYDLELSMNGFTDLGAYIRSPLLYKACWSEIYSKTFEFNTSNEYAWISYPKTNPDLLGKILVHRRYNPARLNAAFPYSDLLELYGDRMVFIGSSEIDYDNFPYKNEIPFYKVTTLDDWFSSVNSCEMMVSNLTAPTVIAHALDKKRIIELPNSADAIHCIGEEKYSSNIFWYFNSNTNYMGNLL
jgi:hypothetical protein